MDTCYWERGDELLKIGEALAAAGKTDQEVADILTQALRKPEELSVSFSRRGKRGVHVKLTTL